MSQVQAINVKVSTQESLLSASPYGSCQLVHLRTKGEVQASNETGTVTRLLEASLQGIL